MSDIPNPEWLRLMSTSAQIQIAVAHHTADLIAVCEKALVDEAPTPEAERKQFARNPAMPPHGARPTPPAEATAEEQITRQRQQPPRNWGEPDMGLRVGDVPEEVVDAKADSEGEAYEQSHDDPGSAVDKAFDAGDQGLRALGRD